MEKWLALFDTCSGVSTDSRQIQEGCLYIALKGENFDGNLFAEKAIAEGARYAIVDNAQLANEENIFYVPNGLLFLQQLAHARQSVSAHTSLSISFAILSTPFGFTVSKRVRK